MKKRMKNSQSRGFTVVETLAVVAIVVILLAISAVSVVHYIDILKITELDNAAREIYMAAENRAVLLSGNQQLGSLMSEGTPTKLEGNGHGGSDDSSGEDETDNVAAFLAALDTDEDDPEAEEPAEELYYVYSTADARISKDLLPAGSIDATLLDGDFYIVYDKISGSVTDVFYAEKDMSGLVGAEDENGTAFSAFYGDWATDRSTRLDLKKTKNILVGWYNGEASEGSMILIDPPGQPQITVLIENKEKLTVTVTVDFDKATVPEDSVREAVITALTNNQLSVKLSAAGQSSNGVELKTISAGSYSDGYLPTGFNQDGTSYSWTWVLDSLDGTKFSYFQGGIAATGVRPGDDFRITASIPKQSPLNIATKSAEDNSLFAKGSGDGTARIEYLRHLQNLDINGGYNSGVGNSTTPVTAAVQIADIFGGSDNSTYKEWKFYPIINGNIKSYTANQGVQGYYAIRNLTLKANPSASVGLFSEFTGNTLGNIRMVNTKVDGTGGSVGALAGTVNNATITNCWVYWESDEAAGVDLQETMKVSGGGASNAYNYQLIGDTVGGLVGTANGSTTITKSLAATLIKGTSVAGGLVGEWNSTGNSITNSYADCYLTGDGQVAGLVGDAQSNVTLSYCYSAGFVMGVSEKSGGFKTAGLCLGSGTTTAQHVYTVLRYPDVSGQNIASDKSNGKIFDLTQTALGSGSDHYYYLSGSDTENGTSGGMSYQTMTDNDENSDKNFARTMNKGNATGTFEWKTAGASNAYDLRANLTLGVYSYPGLKELDHHGDWGAQFKDPSLVYYEHYASKVDGNEWGISGGNARNLFDNLQDKNTVLSDGYAVAFLKANLLDENSTETNEKFKYNYVAVKFKYSDSADGGKTVTIKEYEPTTIVAVNDLKNKQETGWKDEGGNTQTAYFIPLPDELVYSNFALDCFYRYVSFELYYLDSSTIPEGKAADHSGEFLFNPHFAEAIQVYSGNHATANTPDWTADSMAAEASKKAATMGAVRIRTPRHLFDLSEFTQYNKYSYRQALRLDYGTYIWIGMYEAETTTGAKAKPSIMAMTVPKTGGSNKPADLGTDGKLAKLPYAQKPIGDDPTYGGVAYSGTYDGGYSLIQNVTPRVELSETNRYAGLFGYSTGVLRNIVYNMGTDGETAEANYQITSGTGKVSGGVYIGGLAGYNIGTVTNCAVFGVDVKASISGSSLYVGGLIGLNNGMVNNCSAESKSLAGGSYQYGTLYVGGLVGQNADSRRISVSYAVGRIDVEVDNTASARICGFAGQNSGIISNAYAAVDLKSSGTNVEAYGFCANEGSQTGALGYLDQGSYAYRKINFAANYKRENEGEEVAKSYTYAQMTDPEAEGYFRIFAMGKAASAPQGDGEKFPYPAAVMDANNNYIHYGKWPTSMDLGQMGVFYWEKLEINGSASYHISALAVDPDAEVVVTDENGDPVLDDEGNPETTTGAITKVSTLSEAHSDGGAITAYGYGYYSTKGKTVDLETNNLAHYSQGRGRTETSAGIKNLAKTNTEDITDDAELNELAKMLEGYDFWYWNSYHEGGLSQTSSAVGGFRNAQRTAGLYLKYDVSDPNSGTFTLTQGTTDVVFIVNPHFAASMSVVDPGEFTVTDEKLLEAPGTEKGYPYQVRCGQQLQQINLLNNVDSIPSNPSVTKATYSNYVDAAVGERYADHYPYLGGTYLDGTAKSAKYVWNQTHDIDWVAEGNIYYVCQHGTTHGTAENSAYISINDEKNMQACTNKRAETGVFYSIAHATVTGGKLPGWFEGTYDGGSYTIENLYVYANLGTYQPNCMGLFGAVKGATLKDIVLYSEGGNDAITIWGRRDGTATEDMWYAAGVLAGVAQDSTIDNCAVAGYTIKDQTKNARMKTETVPGDTHYTWTISGTLQQIFMSATINVNQAAICLSQNTNNPVKQTNNGTLQNGTYYFQANGTWYQYVVSGTTVTIRYNWYGQNWTDVWTSNLSLSRAEEKDPGITESAYDMGGAIGGLVGMALNTPLNGCVAVVDIDLTQSFLGTSYSDANIKDSDYKEYQHQGYGADAPIRVGGLVGSTTSRVTNCYTGGKVTVGTNAKNAALYIGRIIGGVGAGPFGDTGSSTVSNTYSYMTIPTATSDVIKALYNIGGQGGNNVNPRLETNFYLGSSVSTEADTAAKKVSYLELSGDKGIKIVDGAKEETKDIYQWLNGSDKRTPYDEVTKSLQGGLSVRGRYSYVPMSNTKLQGLDYPFPTILTRETKDVHVHYGEWGLSGIERYGYNEKNGQYDVDLGGSPVELDMYAAEAGQNDPGIHEELLKLSSDSGVTVKTGGTWKVKSGDTDVVTVEFVNAAAGSSLGANANDTSGQIYLKMTAVSSSDIPVTVTVEYTEPGNDGDTYTVEITVNVKAGVTLTPGSLSVFPKDEVTVTLTPKDVEVGTKYTLVQQKDKETNAILPITSSVSWLWATARQNEDGSLALTVHSLLNDSVDEDDQLWIEVPYTYTQGEGENAFSVDGTHRIMITLLEQPEGGTWDTTGNPWTWDVTFKGTSVTLTDNTTVTASWEKGNAEVIKNNNGTFSKVVKVTTAANAAIPANSTLTVENVTVTEIDKNEWQHKVTVDVPQPITQEELTLSVTQGENDSWIIRFDERYTLVEVTSGDAAATRSGSTVTLTRVGQNTKEVTLTVTLTDDNGLKQKLNVTVDLTAPEVKVTETAIEQVDGSWPVDVDVSGWTLEGIAVGNGQSNNFGSKKTDNGKWAITLESENFEWGDDETQEVTLIATLSRNGVQNGPQLTWNVTFTVSLEKPADKEEEKEEKEEAETVIEGEGEGNESIGAADERIIAIVPTEPEPASETAPGAVETGLEPSTEAEDRKDLVEEALSEKDVDSEEPGEEEGAGISLVNVFAWITLRLQKLFILK